MTRAVLPPMPRPPKGATSEDRERMYAEYCAELERLNPHLRGALPWTAYAGLAAFVLVLVSLAAYAV